MKTLIIIYFIIGLILSIITDLTGIIFMCMSKERITSVKKIYEVETDLELYIELAKEVINDIILWPYSLYRLISIIHEKLNPRE